MIAILKPETLGCFAVRPVFTVLGRDPRTVPTAEIRDVPVRMTIVGGETVWEA